jgi:preprotein translocase subunit YajC
MSLFIASAHAQAAGAPPPQGGEMFQILFLVGLFVLFYFIAIRPQRKRQKEHQQMVSALAKGDEVVTSSGILGKVTSLDDNYMVLNVANNVDMKFQRVHVHAILPKGTLKSIA